VGANKICCVAGVFLSAATFATVYFSAHVLADESGQKTSNIHQTQTGYDAAILSDRPVLFLSLGNSGERSFEVDASGSGVRGSYLPLGSRFSTVKMPNGDLAPEFDGATQYLEVASSPRLSTTTTGVLTIEAWIAPKTLQFGHEQGSGYVYWLGKGEPSQYEYAGRIYSAVNSEIPPRPNRISGYVFNRIGGLGSGSYLQDPISVGEWIYVTLIFNTRNVSPQFPMGYCSIFKNGVLRQITSLAEFNTEPTRGTAPLRVGTMNGKSFFGGAIGKVAIYDFELSGQQILNHAQMMFGSSVRGKSLATVTIAPRPGLRSAPTNDFASEPR
jgi:hypothetical protein